MFDPIVILLLMVLIALGITLTVGPEKLRKPLLGGIVAVLGLMGLRALDKLIVRGGASTKDPLPTKPDVKTEIEAAEKEEIAVEAAKKAAKEAAPERDIAPDLEKLAARSNRRRKERKR